MLAGSISKKPDAELFAFYHPDGYEINANQWKEIINGGKSIKINMTLPDVTKANKLQELFLDSDNVDWGLDGSSNKILHEPESEGGINFTDPLGSVARLSKTTCSTYKARFPSAHGKHSG